MEDEKEKIVYVVKERKPKTAKEIVNKINDGFYFCRKFIMLGLCFVLVMTMFATFVSFEFSLFGFSFNGFELIIAIFKGGDSLTYLFGTFYGNALLSANNGMIIWTTLAGLIFVLYICILCSTIRQTIQSYRDKKKTIRTNQSFLLNSIVILLATIILIFSYYKIQSCIGSNISGSEYWIFLLIWSLATVGFSSYIRFNKLNTETRTLKQYLLDTKKQRRIQIVVLVVIITICSIGFGVYAKEVKKEQERQRLIYEASPIYAIDYVINALNDSDMIKAFEKIDLGKPNHALWTGSASYMTNLGNKENNAKYFIQANKTIKNIKLLSATEIFLFENVALYECKFNIKYGNSTTDKTLNVFLRKGNEYLKLYDESMWTMSGESLIGKKNAYGDIMNWGYAAHDIIGEYINGMTSTLTWKMSYAFSLSGTANIIYNDAQKFLLYNNETDIYPIYYWGDKDRIVLPNNVTKVTEEVFWNFRDMRWQVENNEAFIGNTTIIFNEGLKLIEKGSFYDFYNLYEIELPSTLKEIGSHAFMGTNIEKIIIPSSVETIGAKAFNQRVEELHINSEQLIKITPIYEISNSTYTGIYNTFDATSANNEVFLSVSSSLKIYVPSGSPPMDVESPYYLEWWLDGDTVIHSPRMQTWEEIYKLDWVTTYNEDGSHYTSAGWASYNNFIYETP